MRQQRLHVQPLRLRLQEPVPAGGHHHRIDDQTGQPAGGRESGDSPHDLRRGEHPGLHRRDGEVLEHRVDLRDHEVGGHPVDAADALRVLGGKRGDRAGAEDAEAANVLRSAWTPAPPLESEPAIVSATGGVIRLSPSARRGRRVPSRGRA